MKLNVSDVEEAKRALFDLIEPTPLILNEWLSRKYGCNIYLKLENMQPIGSFKIRGATYKISSLTDKQKKKGVIAASAGNHAQGVAWAARRFKSKATIVMPVNAPLAKIQNTKTLGAEVVLFGESFEEAFQHAKKIGRSRGLTFIHAYDDEKVIAGQGTLAVEILEQLPETDIVIGSIGGGGLMSGVGLVLKTLKPKILTIGAQASGARSMVESLSNNKVVLTGKADTFADGIKVKNVSPRIFKFLNKYIDTVAHVDDEEIAAGVLTLLEKARIISEGAGALPLSVFHRMYMKNPKTFKNKNIVLIVCGGNIDVNVLSRIIDRGLTLTGRRVRFNMSIPDRPGALHAITKIIAESGASIIQAIHDRDMPSVGIHETGVEMAVETRGAEHSAKLIQNLKKHFPKIEVFG